MDRIRVYVVHEDGALARLTASLLANSPGIRALGHCSSALEAQARLGKGLCDIVLVSATLPNDGAVKLIRMIRSVCAPTKILVTGLAPDTRAIMHFVAAGASGYILEDENIQVLRDRIYAISEGKAAVSPAVAATMMMHLTKLSKLTARFDLRPIAYANLTEREQEILDMLGQGVSNQDIAEQLVIGLGTVKNHVHSVLKKLNLRSRKDAANFLSLVSCEPAPIRGKPSRTPALLN